MGIKKYVILLIVASGLVIDIGAYFFIFSKPEDPSSVDICVQGLV